MSNGEHVASFYSLMESERW